MIPFLSLKDVTVKHAGEITQDCNTLLYEKYEK